MRKFWIQLHYFQNSTFWFSKLKLIDFEITKFCFVIGTTGALLLCAFLMDVIVWVKAGSVNFAEDNPEDEDGAVEGLGDAELHSITDKSITEQTDTEH